MITLAYFITVVASLLAGALFSDIRLASKIRGASSGYLDPIVFTGGALTHIRALTILDDDELSDVISNL